MNRLPSCLALALAPILLTACACQLGIFEERRPGTAEETASGTLYWHDAPTSRTWAISPAWKDHSVDSPDDAIWCSARLGAFLAEDGIGPSFVLTVKLHSPCPYDLELAEGPGLELHPLHLEEARFEDGWFVEDLAFVVSRDALLHFCEEGVEVRFTGSTDHAMTIPAYFCSGFLRAVDERLKSVNAHIRAANEG